MKRKAYITRTSLISTIDFMMAPTGLNREQATIAFHTIMHYLRKYPYDPLYRLIGYFTGNNKEEGDGSSLN